MNGWVDDTATTWTYVSATEFSVPGDQTDKFRIGGLLRWKQVGGFKYAYVAHLAKDASNTFVTIAAGSDYSLANATITDNWIGYGVTAQGFPGVFNFSLLPWGVTSGTSPSLGSGTLSGKFSMQGPEVDFTWALLAAANTTFGNGGQWQFPLPVPFNVGYPMQVGQNYSIDNGVQ